jgi:hypothetical protein
MQNSGGSVTLNGAAVAGVTLSTLVNSASQIVISGLPPEFNRAPDMFSVYIYKAQSNAPIFYNTDTSLARPMYTLVHLRGTTAIGVGYDSSKIYAGLFTTASLPFFASDAIAANSASVPAIKLYLYYFL